MIIKYIFCFIFGSIPFAVFIPYIFYGINITRLGSKNPGTTNAYRVLSEHTNKPLSIILTGIIGILESGKSVMCGLIGGSTGALIAVLGQIYSPFLSFRGGKGVASFLGAFIGATRDPMYLIAPITWGLLTFVPKLIAFMPNDNQYKRIGPLRMKASLVASLVAIIISMTLLVSTEYNRKVKLEFIIIMLLILYKHIHYVKVGPGNE